MCKLQTDYRGISNNETTLSEEIASKVVCTPLSQTCCFKRGVGRTQAVGSFFAKGAQGIILCVVARCWAVGDTEVRPQTLEGKLGALILPVENPYNDQEMVWVTLGRGSS